MNTLNRIETCRPKTAQVSTRKQVAFTSPREDVPFYQQRIPVSGKSTYSALSLPFSARNKEPTMLAKNPSVVSPNNASLARSITKIKSGEIHSNVLHSRTYRLENAEKIGKITSAVSSYFRDGNEDYMRIKEKSHQSKRASRVLELLYPKNRANDLQMDERLKGLSIRETYAYFAGAERERLQKEEQQRTIREHLEDVIFDRKEKRKIPTTVSSKPYLTKKFITTFSDRFEGTKSIGKLQRTLFDDIIQKYKNQGDQFAVPKFDDLAPKETQIMFEIRRKNSLGQAMKSPSSRNEEPHNERELEMDVANQFEFLLERNHLIEHKKEFIPARKHGRLPNRTRFKGLHLNLIE